MTTTPALLDELLLQQQQYFAKHPIPSAAERRHSLDLLKSALLKHQDALIQAINQDYGNRSLTESKIGELLTCIEQIKYYQKHLSRWMRPSKRRIGILHQPASGYVSYEPYGVIGIITPWNYPLVLSMGPLICALAAGNVAMVKLSGASMHFGKVLKTALSEVFMPSQVAVVYGDDISEHFGKLPFDKLIFTGSSAVGRIVMQQAAANLTPVLLELGGKSPAIVHESMPMADAAERLAFGKLWNAGQTCVAPDHLYLPRGKLDEFIDCYQKQVAKMYPTLAKNPDYTSIIHARQYDKLRQLLTDAATKGATIIHINPANDSDEMLKDIRKIPPTIVHGVSDEMLIMQQEIFGPILPIIEYDDIDQVIHTINQGDRPLALYYFDYNKQRGDYIRQCTHSGHFGQNGVVTHVAQDDLPFGGVGASGMGKYHGPEGFYSFSHARSVMYTPKIFGLRLILPPFASKFALTWIERLFLR